jgi:quercetin dioxygenase-like cupin family protein
MSTDDAAGTLGSALIVRADEGRRLGGAASRPVVKVGPHIGSRLIGVLESDLPPGSGFPGHVHEDYEEVFYVLAGNVDYLIGDTWTTASAGSTVFVPPGTTHGFRNSGTAAARHLAIASPAESMTMIEDLVAAQPAHMADAFARYRSRSVSG